jgi:hypothetical protein
MKIVGGLYLYQYFLNAVSNSEVNTFYLQSNGVGLQHSAPAHFCQEVVAEQCLHRCAATVVLALVYKVSQKSIGILQNSTALVND